MTTPSRMPIDREVLICRVVEGRAAAGDWLLLQQVAAADPSLWNDLAGSQDQATCLHDEVRAQVACAERVNVPSVRLAGVTHEAGRSHRGAGRLRPALPWALAATLGVAFFAQFYGQPARSGAPGMQAAGLVGSAPTYASPDEAMAAYLDLGKQQGRVVGELPQRYVVESRPTPDGKGYEVLYVRQLLERAVVSDLYRTGTDDSGRTVLLPATPPGPSGAPM